jgi:hypothetical protein
VNGVRYALRSDGQPEDSALNQRSARRNLQAVGLVSSPPKSSCGVDDCEPVQLDFMGELSEAIVRMSFNNLGMMSTNDFDD